MDRKYYSFANAFGCVENEIDTWWNQAVEDLNVAQYNLKGGWLSPAAFFSQQAAEKALKALQIKKSGRFDRTHDLVLLAGKVGASAEITRTCEKITPLYTITRYPDVGVTITKKDAKSSLSAAKKVVKWAAKQLK